MAFNYYEGWTELELLTERKMIQQQLSSGRLTEIRLAGELTRTDSKDAAALETTLERIAYALYQLCLNGLTGANIYANPSANAGVTLQRFG